MVRMVRMAKAYITKYALTDGIIEKEGRIVKDTYFDVEKYGFFSKGDYFFTKEEAIEKAEKMRLKKIESLKKQILKLEKLTFKDL